MTGANGFLVAHVGSLYHIAQKSLLVSCVSRYKRGSKMNFESNGFYHLLGPANRRSRYDIRVFVTVHFEFLKYKFPLLF